MTHWTSTTYAANGIDIHYLRTGGAKPPLILLHGLTANGACWTPLARALEADFDVIMPDARGHGATSTPLEGYRYADLARDVVELISGLGLDTPFLLGHSMGGMTAAVVASQMGAELRGVILADPTFLSPERQQEVYASDAAEQHRQFIMLDRAAAIEQARARQPHRSAEIIELVIDARLNTRAVTYDVLTPPNPEYHELVSAFDAPSLLILADKGVITLETAHELQALNPRLNIEQIQNAGHGLHYDQPEPFARVVKAFLSGI